MAVRRRDGLDEAEARRLQRKDRRRNARRDAILVSARRLLASAGPAAFTMAAVADAAGVSKPSLYYYYSSKEELVGALAVEVLREEARVLREAVHAAPSGVQALGALVRAYVDHHSRDLDSFRVLYVWPQVLGIHRRVLESDVYPESRAVNDDLERRLKEDAAAGGLVAAANPRKLANVAWVAAHGLVSLLAGLDAAGGATLFPAAELRDETIRVVVAAARRG